MDIGHCLNMKVWEKNQSLDEVDFGSIRMWVQVHSLSGEMINGDNARQIASKVGKGLAFAYEQEMQARGYIRFLADLSTRDPLCPGFWWVNDRGVEKWVHLKYERLSDLCYGCGCLGHSSQVCELDIATSEVNPDLPMYGPWLSCPRQRKLNPWIKPGGDHANNIQRRDPARRTWQDMMKDGRAFASKGIKGSLQAKSVFEASSWVTETQFEPAPDIGE